jgi:hypothetical protein
LPAVFTRYFGPEVDERLAFAALIAYASMHLVFAVIEYVDRMIWEWFFVGDWEMSIRHFFDFIEQSSLFFGKFEKVYPKVGFVVFFVRYLEAFDLGPVEGGASFDSAPEIVPFVVAEFGIMHS